jgi:hypothetical protein
MLWALVLLHQHSQENMHKQRAQNNKPSNNLLTISALMTIIFWRQMNKKYATFDYVYSSVLDSVPNES